MWFECVLFHKLIGELQEIKGVAAAAAAALEEETRRAESANSSAFVEQQRSHVDMVSRAKDELATEREGNRDREEAMR